MKHVCGAVLALLSAGVICSASAQNDTNAVSPEARKAGEEKAVNLCSTCHGPRGVSTSPEFPILAAQRQGYLVNQIENFRSKTRSEKDAHDFMWGIAGNLDPSIIAGIAAYYAQQPAAPGRAGNPTLMAQGKELFDKGLPGRGIPACGACHGSNAEGMADFPRLAGQHAKYVAKQINYIQSLVRTAPVMHGIVKDLSPPEINALAEYVQSK